MIVAQEQGDIKIKKAQWMILLVERKELKQKKAQWISTLCISRGYFYRSRYAAKDTFRKILCKLCALQRNTQKKRIGLMHALP